MSKISTTAHISSRDWQDLHASGSPTRDDFARYLLTHREVVRRRLRGKLRRAVRAADPENILSSVLRRVDLALSAGIIRARSECEYWAYVIAITDNLAIERLRRTARSGILQQRLTNHLRHLRAPFRGCDTDDHAAIVLHRIIMSLDKPADRELLLWRLQGASYAAISATTGRSQTSIRQQWSKLCRAVRARHTAPSTQSPSTRARRASRVSER